MKTKLIEMKFKSAIGRAGHLFSRIACLGAVILICTSVSAQNLVVSGTDAHGGKIFNSITFDVPGAGTGPGQGTQGIHINPAGAITGYYLDSGDVFHGYVRAP